MRNLDHFYMSVAFLAADLSRCQRKQVGAVAVKDGNILGFSYNGTATGWHTNICEIDGKTTPHVLHAEENLICKLAKSNISSVGATIYITWAPCMACSRMMKQAGIEEIVYSEPNDKGGIDFVKQLGIKIRKLS